MTLPDGLNAYFCTNTETQGESLAIKILKIDGKVINSNTGVLHMGAPDKPCGEGAPVYAFDSAKLLHKQKRYRAISAKMRHLTEIFDALNHFFFIDRESALQRGLCRKEGSSDI